MGSFRDVGDDKALADIAQGFLEGYPYDKRVLPELFRYTGLRSSRESAASSDVDRFIETTCKTKNDPAGENTSPDRWASFAKIFRRRIETTSLTQFAFEAIEQVRRANDFDDPKIALPGRPGDPGQARKWDAAVVALGITALVFDSALDLRRIAVAGPKIEFVHFVSP